jgi:hypothetical protein
LQVLPKPVERVLITVSSLKTERVVRDATAAGIRCVWM